MITSPLGSPSLVDCSHADPFIGTVRGESFGPCAGVFSGAEEEEAAAAVAEEEEAAAAVVVAVGSEAVAEPAPVADADAAS